MSCSSEDVEKILPYLNINKAGLGGGGGGGGGEWTDFN